MAGTVNDPRFIARTAIGVDWQATEGEAVPGAPFSPAQFVVAMDLSRDPDPTYLEPMGTHGAIFKRFQGNRIISQAFKKELKLWGGRFQVLPFLESVVSGDPTVIDADNTRTGAGAGDITAFSLIGARPYHNVQGFDSSPALATEVTIQMVETPGFPVTVSVYKEAAKTTLLATATVAAAATPTALVASGTSGLTGSITLATAATADALATINKITYNFANQFTKFFRLFYDEGNEVAVLSDCVVQEMVFESAENGELSATIQIMGKRRDFFTSVLTIDETQLDVTPYSHSELTLTVDPSGSPESPVVDDFSFQIVNDVLQYIANSPTPQKLIKRGFTEIGGSFSGESSDEMLNRIKDARANTGAGLGFDAFRADYLLGGKTMRFDMLKVRPQLAEPGIEGELVSKTELEYNALYDGITDPVAITVDM